MVYLFVLVAGFLGVGLYLTIMYSSIPGAVDERLGSLEELPPDLGQWVIDDQSVEAKAELPNGLVREVRHLHQPARWLLGRQMLVRQVRYRDSHNKIVRVDPEVKLPRRRHKRKHT